SPRAATGSGGSRPFAGGTRSCTRSRSPWRTAACATWNRACAARASGEQEESDGRLRRDRGGGGECRAGRGGGRAGGGRRGGGRAREGPPRGPGRQHALQRRPLPLRLRQRGGPASPRARRGAGGRRLLHERRAVSAEVVLGGPPARHRGADRRRAGRD